MANKVKKAANLAREIWRLQGYCEKCGKTKAQGQLHGAHIIGVGTAIRVAADVTNGFCLCSYCHRFYHDHPHDFTEWAETTWAKDFIPIIRERARPSSGPKIDWDAKIIWLKETKKAIEEGKLTINEARLQEL